MAFRFALVRFNNKEGSFLLRQTRTVVKPMMRSQPKSSFRPGAGFLEKPKSLLFAPDNVKKHKDNLLIIYNLPNHLSGTMGNKLSMTVMAENGDLKGLTIIIIFSLLLHEITLIIIAKRTLLCLAKFNVDFLLMIKRISHEDQRNDNDVFPFPLSLQRDSEALDFSFVLVYNTQAEAARQSSIEILQCLGFAKHNDYHPLILEQI
uniref:Uncharacterized protein n=1 Tax=Glossina palpalis gambiensis TaxID=67801 RepID=A0A1B0BZ36_9MUSC